MLLKELCPELRAEVESIWRQAWKWGLADLSFRPFCSWPITNCQARQEQGHLVKAQTESSCVGRGWDARRLFQKCCCELVKSWADTGLNEAADWQVHTWTCVSGQEEATVDFFLSRQQSDKSDHIHRRTNCIFDINICFLFFIYLYLILSIVLKFSICARTNWNKIFCSSVNDGGLINNFFVWTWISRADNWLTWLNTTNTTDIEILSRPLEATGVCPSPRTSEHSFYTQPEQQHLCSVILVIRLLIVQYVM